MNKNCFIKGFWVILLTFLCDGNFEETISLQLHKFVKTTEIVVHRIESNVLDQSLVQHMERTFESSAIVTDEN